MFDDDLSLQKLNDMGKNTMLDNLGIEFTEINKHYLKAKMPVDHRTVQPFKLLHGGASVALAETLGSVASFLLIDAEQFAPVGLEINANHIKSANTGEWVEGKVSPIHIGTKTHVWEIKILNTNDDLVCVSRLTVAIVKRKK